MPQVMSVDMLEIQLAEYSIPEVVSIRKRLTGCMARKKLGNRLDAGLNSERRLPLEKGQYGVGGGI